MPGNALGPRLYYAYTSDGGVAYKYLTDQDLGTAVGATLNDTNPDMPKRFKPRGVYVESSSGNRKFVICPLLTTTAYNSNASTSVTIDGVTFKTTGRKGEKQSFGSNPDVETQPA